MYSSYRRDVSARVREKKSTNHIHVLSELKLRVCLLNLHREAVERVALRANDGPSHRNCIIGLLDLLVARLERHVILLDRKLTRAPRVFCYFN